jgi:tetratricopeptide (TPR) repeat protein/DNA-binding CsgD family transcriptional regulator
MARTNRTAEPDVRVLETRRQMLDRLASLLAALGAPAGEQAATVREHAIEALKLAERLGNRAGIVLAERAVALCDLAEHRPEAALAGFTRLLRKLDDDQAVAAETLVAISRVRAMLSDTEGAHAALVEARTRYDALGDSDGLALVATARGNLFTDAGSYPEALEWYAEALKLREERGDDEQIGVCTFDVAMVYAAIGDRVHAVELLEHGCSLFERSGAYDLHARARSAVAALLMADGRLEEALAASLHALVLLEVAGDNDAIIETLQNIAVIHERAGRGVNGMAAIVKAVELAESIGGARLGGALHALAAMERRAGRPWHAAATLDRALAVATESGDDALACRVHEALAAVFEEMSVADKALEHYRRYMSLRDAMHGEKQRRAVAEVDLRLALDRVQQERDLYRVRSERLQADLDLKNRELASATLGAVQSNRVLDQLEGRVTERFKGRRDAQLFVRDVRREIAALRDAAGEWTPFEERLDAVHQDFIAMLRGLYPDLTQAQLMVCALVRANFDTRDIAAALYVSERTVENHRYRLRRKLGLAPDTNLASYLASLC